VVVVARWWDQRNGEKRRSSERSEGIPRASRRDTLLTSEYITVVAVYIEK
jgi:hypothetical protein